MALRRRYFFDLEEDVLNAQADVARCFERLGRHHDALVLRRATHDGFAALFGELHESTIGNGNNVALSLGRVDCWDEAMAFLRDELLPAAQRRSLGDDNELMLTLRQTLAYTLPGPEQPEEHPRRPAFE